MLRHRRPDNEPEGVQAGADSKGKESWATASWRRKVHRGHRCRGYPCERLDTSDHGKARISGVLQSRLQLLDNVFILGKLSRL
jgi:hypothetical protein